MNLNAGRVCTLMTVAFLIANTSQAAQEFAVASVKPNLAGIKGGEGSEREKITLSPTGVILSNMSLKSCIRWAFEVRDNQIAGPAWLDSQRYDISAKADGPSDTTQMKAMMRKLLADRFHLETHRESKELPVYEMVVSKKGSKLHAASETGDNNSSNMRPSGGALEFHNYSMPEFAERFGARPLKLDRLVVDRTSLKGTYDFRLEFADNEANLKHTLEGMDRGGIDQDGLIFTIVEEQLGLRLKATKASVESLVIAHADRNPVSN